MSEPTGPNDELGKSEGQPRGDAPEAGARVVRRKRSMWEDRRVRIMAFGATFLVILYLITIVSLLVFGFIGGDDAPRTALERDVIVTESIVRSGEATATIDQWQSYTEALVFDRRFQTAETIINEVNANTVLDQTQGQNMLFATAVLRDTQGRIDEAIDLYVEVMELTREAYEEELASGVEPNWAMAFGLHDNYYRSAVRLAALYASQERWEEGIEMLDLYLGDRPRSAGVLADRGHLKVQLGDTEGAAADYREALRFDPELTDAREGLEEIGAGE